MDPSSTHSEIEGRVLKDFVASAPAGFLMLDQNLHAVEVSPRWTSDWGSARSSLLGRHLYETYLDLPAHIKVAHGRALAGEVVNQADDRFTWNGLEIRCAWQVRPWGNVKRGEGGIIIYAEDLGSASADLGTKERLANEPGSQGLRVSERAVVRAISLAQEGRASLQMLMAAYRENTCTCAPGHYAEHLTHQLECLANATAPAIVHSEKAIRQLYLLEQWFHDVLESRKRS